MFISKKRLERLEATVELLAKRVHALEAQDKAVKQRTVEDIVKDNTPPMTTARMFDEWFNGKEDKA